MELASETGRGRRRTEFTMAKRAVLAPMQTQNVSRTVKAKPLARQRERAAYLRSSRKASMVPSFEAKRNGRGYSPAPGCGTRVSAESSDFLGSAWAGGGASPHLCKAGASSRTPKGAAYEVWTGEHFTPAKHFLH